MYWTRDTGRTASLRVYLVLIQPQYTGRIPSTQYTAVTTYTEYQHRLCTSINIYETQEHEEHGVNRQILNSAGQLFWS